MPVAGALLDGQKRAAVKAMLEKANLDKQKKAEAFDWMEDPSEEQDEKAEVKRASQNSLTDQVWIFREQEICRYRLLDVVCLNHAMFLFMMLKQKIRSSVVKTQGLARCEASLRQVKGRC